MRQTDKIAKAKQDLRQALQILTCGMDYASEEWALLATLLGDADLALDDAALSDVRALAPLRDEVLRQLRGLTEDFSDPTFLRASRSARRRNPRPFAREA